MRTEEVAGALRRRPRSIYKLRDRGVLHPLPGRPLLFDRAEILDFLGLGVPKPAR
jgi:hypothetical protein